MVYFGLVETRHFSKILRFTGCFNRTTKWNSLNDETLRFYVCVAFAKLVNLLEHEPVILVRKTKTKTKTNLNQ